MDDLKHNLIGVETDVTSKKSIQNLFQKTIEKHGRIDILLNIVGSYIGGDEMADTKESDWDFMMNVNLKSASCIQRLH